MTHIVEESKDIDFWRRQIPIAGIDNVLASLRLFEEKQEYLECAKIKTAIEQHNERVNDNLSTR